MSLNIIDKSYMQIAIRQLKKLLQDVDKGETKEIPCTIKALDQCSNRLKDHTTPPQESKLN